jgi:hypothetical protein
MKKSIFIIFTLFASIMYGQNGTIKGKILDKQSELH